MLKREEREVTEVQGYGLLLGHQGFRVGFATEGRYAWGEKVGPLT